MRTHIGRYFYPIYISNVNLVWNVLANIKLNERIKIVQAFKAQNLCTVNDVANTIAGCVVSSWEWENR